MCVIIAGEHDTALPSIDELRRWQESNPHGWGWAWTDERGDVRRARGIGKVRIPRSLKWVPGRWMVHLRFATTGQIVRDNAHPFWVGEGALAHNGVMSHLPWAHGWGEWSDTRAVAHWLDQVIYKRRSVPSKRGYRAVEKAIEKVVGPDRIAWLTPYDLHLAGPGWERRESGRWYTTSRDVMAPSPPRTRTWSWARWRDEAPTTSKDDEARITRLQALVRAAVAAHPKKAEPPTAEDLVCSPLQRLAREEAALDRQRELERLERLWTWKDASDR